MTFGSFWKGASCGRHTSGIMEMPHGRWDTCSSAEVTKSKLFDSQPISTPAKDASSPHQTRRCEEAAVAGDGEHWIQHLPTAKFLHQDAKDWKVTDEIIGHYQSFFKEECTAVISCIQRNPLWASAQGACATLDFSKIASEPSPLCDCTMEFSYLQVEDWSSKLGLNTQEILHSPHPVQSVVEEDEEKEWHQESSGSSVSISKKASVSSGSKDAACITCSTNSSPECKVNRLNTQGTNGETGDCLEEVNCETGQKGGSSSLIDGATNSTRGTCTLSESSFLTNSVSDSCELEMESKNKCAGCNLTECIPGPRSAVELPLNQSEDTGNEKATAERTYDASMEAEHAGGIGMCNLDGTLDKDKDMFLVTSTPLVVPKSFNFAKAAPPTASHIKKPDVGSVVKQPSVDGSSAAGPSTDFLPPSKLKCPTRALPKPTTLTRRDSSNTVSNKNSLLPASGPPTNRKSLLPALRSSAIPLCVPVRGPSSSGVSSLGQKTSLNSRHMASTSSLEGKKLNAPASTKILTSALSKPPPSALGPPRSRLDLVSSTVLEKTTSQPSTLSKKQPRGNTDDALPLTKKKKIDTPGSGTSSMAVKGLAASTSVFKRPVTRQTSMQLKKQKNGASRMSGTLISKTSAKVDSTALARPCEMGPQPSGRSTECESCARYRQEIEQLRAELQRYTAGTSD